MRLIAVKYISAYIIDEILGNQKKKNVSKWGFLCPLFKVKSWVIDLH